MVGGLYGPDQSCDLFWLKWEVDVSWESGRQENVAAKRDAPLDSLS